MNTLLALNPFQLIIKVSASLMIIAILFLGGIQNIFAQEAECTDPLGCVNIAATDPIHIAYALGTSGDIGWLGIDERNGVEIAIDDVGGQILGHNILFDGADSECSASGGLAAGTGLAADPTIVAVVGTSCSSAAMSAMPVLSSAGLSMVSPSNTAPSLTNPGDPNNHLGYFRTIHNDIFQSQAAAEFAREELGALTVATIDDGSPYSTEVRQEFVNEFLLLGGTVTDQITISIGQTDMNAELETIAAGYPSLIFMPVFMPEGAHIINQARATPGLENTFLLGTDGLYLGNFGPATGANVDGFMVTAPDFTKYSPEYTDSFLPAYQAKYGYEPTSSFHANAYDAFMLIKLQLKL